jgi:hypothetical protein
MVLYATYVCFSGLKRRDIVLVRCQWRVPICVLTVEHAIEDFRQSHAMVQMQASERGAGRSSITFELDGNINCSAVSR